MTAMSDNDDLPWNGWRQAAFWAVVVTVDLALCVGAAFVVSWALSYLLDR
jgi:hypothetical protein